MCEYVSPLTSIVLSLFMKWSSPTNTRRGEKSQGFTSFWFLWYWLRLALLSSYVLLKCVSPSITICTRDRLSSTSPFRTSSGFRKLRAWQTTLICQAFSDGVQMNQTHLKVCSLFCNSSISVVHLNKCEHCHLNKQTETQHFRLPNKLWCNSINIWTQHRLKTSKNRTWCEKMRLELGQNSQAHLILLHQSHCLLAVDLYWQHKNSCSSITPLDMLYALESYKLVNILYHHMYTHTTSTFTQHTALFQMFVNFAM